LLHRKWVAFLGATQRKNRTWIIFLLN